MTTSHRAGQTSRQPDYPQRPQAPGGPAEWLPKLVANWGRLGIGTFCGGLVAVIAAVIIHDHAAYPNSLCNTGVGELGQAFSNTIQNDCGTAGMAESMVGWLVFLGVVGIVLGLAKIGIGLAGGMPSAPRAPGVRRPAAAHARAAAGPATPAANQAAYGSAPTPPPPAQASHGYNPISSNGPVVPERPAPWAPPPPPPGPARPTWPEA